MSNAVLTNADSRRMKTVVFGVVIGGLAGAATLLLLAAQPGKQATVKIRQTSMQWLERSAGNGKVDGARAGSESGGGTSGIREMAEQTRLFGRKWFGVPPDLVYAVRQNGKMTVHVA
ncbi:MAG: hypothetical protein WBM17_00525 [Anaerolineales bacterium]